MLWSGELIGWLARWVGSVASEAKTNLLIIPIADLC